MPGAATSEPEESPEACRARALTEEYAETKTSDDAVFAELWERASKSRSDAVRQDRLTASNWRRGAHDRLAAVELEDTRVCQTRLSGRTVAFGTAAGIVVLVDLEAGTVLDGFDAHTDKSRSWRNLFFSRRLTRSLFLFAIEHESGELPKPKVNRSQIDRLDHVVINTNDPDGFISLYRDKFGIKLSLDQTVEKWGGRMLFFRLNKTTIEVIGKIDKETEPKDSFWGLAWSVNDLNAVYQRLADDGVELTDIREGRKPRTIVCTVKSHTLGVPTLLIQHLDR